VVRIEAVCPQVIKARVFKGKLEIFRVYIFEAI